jgi:hypothetical protein
MGGFDNKRRLALQSTNQACARYIRMNMQSIGCLDSCPKLKLDGEQALVERLRPTQCCCSKLRGKYDSPRYDGPFE